MEQYAVWHMYRGALLRASEKTTLTRTDKIIFEKMGTGCSLLKHKKGRAGAWNDLFPIS